MWHYVYCRLTEAEFKQLKMEADRDNLPMSQFIRECVNDRLVESLPPEAPLISTPKCGRPRLRMAKAQVR